jgi:ABC-type sugar transport system ATPase subunit
VRNQKQRGASFIYISHYLDEIFEIADRATVLRNGKVAGAAAVADLTQRDLVHMISGTSVKRFTRERGNVGDEVLGTRNLTRDRAYYDINLSVRAGEVVGLTGLEGSGPGALARGLFGLEEMGTGHVTIDGKPFEGGNPSKALHQGLAYLPRDRHGLGIVGILSVRDNVSLSVLERLKSVLGLVDRKKERALVNEYISALSIKTPTMDTPISSLSGGNQQKCVVAKFAATEPRVLILDEPTQGVDVEAKIEILRIVDDLSKRGVAICVVSDELNELIDICDRISLQ